MRTFVSAAFALLMCVAALRAADVPGSKDPSFLKRYQGSEIVFSVTRSFDAYKLIVPDTAHPGQTTTEDHEGEVRRLFYRIPSGHTALELLRNYEQAVKQAGLAVAYERVPCRQTDRPTLSAVTDTVPGTQGSDWVKTPLGRAEGDAGSDGPFCFFTAKGNTGGQDVALTMAVSEKSDRSDGRNYSFRFGEKSPVVTFNPGEAVVMVDVITTKSVANKMVTVKATDIADALATKGSFDLYGIFFDVDKAIVKPESDSTLDQVATLLKIDRSLRLEVSGHTDQTGSADHNVKLSQARAAAVVDALVKKYGIAATRLQAKGYGDTKPLAPNDTEANRAKNRRVELKKL